jgi:indole-3-glycerol phosphate synthase
MTTPLLPSKQSTSYQNSRIHMMLLQPFMARIANTKQNGAIPIIAEIKAFSPSLGDLLKGRDIRHIAREYARAGAACISVVTGRWYHGSPVMLEMISQAVDLPVLRKDFITSKDQLRESRQLGASAVLLTRRLLATRHLEQLAACCGELELVPFIEVADATELADLKMLPGTVLAVNNRDIRVKETDDTGVSKSLALLPSMPAGKGLMRVSASGITSPQEARRLFHAGFDALLIGTALMQAENIAHCVSEFASIRNPDGETLLRRRSVQS